MSEPYLKIGYPQVCARCKRRIWANTNYLVNEWAEPVCPVDCMTPEFIKLRALNDALASNATVGE